MNEELLAREPKGKARRRDLDGLRVFAMGIVFLFHCTRFFDAFPWHLKNAETSVVATVFVGFCELWQMPLLMLVSGAGTWLALESRTPSAYLVERASRLLVPFYTVGLFLLIPPQYYWESVTNHGFAGSFPGIYPRLLGTIRLDPGVNFLAYWSGHLWFLHRLFVISLFSLPPLLFLRTECGHRIVRRLAGLFARPWGLVLFIPAKLLLFAVIAPAWSGGGSAIDFLHLWIFFGIGAFLAADERFRPAMTTARYPALAVGTASFAGLGYLVLGAGFPPDSPPRYEWIHALFQLLTAVATWSWIVFFAGTAARRIRNAGAVLAYANEAVLPFYILHQTVILAVGWLIIRTGLPIPAKWAIIAIASFGTIAAIYEAGIRRFRWMRLLFGMRPLRRSVGT